MTTPPRSHIFSHTSDTTTFPAGTTLFHAGEPGDVMYVVKSGEVELVVGGQIVEIVSADGIFGELALLDGEHRSTTAITRSDSELLVLNQKQFMLMVRQTPFFAIEIMRTIAGRLRSMDARLSESSSR